MFKSSAVKLFFGFLLIFASSCSFWRKSETPAPSPTPFVPTEIKSEIPFSTKELEIYQVEIISTTYATGEKTERKIFTARNAAKRLTAFNYGEKNEIARMEFSADTSISINHSKKVYTENAPSNFSGDSENDFLTTEWLNQKTPATYENLGSENNLSKFRVKLGNTEATNSEILIYVDDNLKIPVRQEIYSVNGEQRTLTYSVELKDFKTSVDEKFFEIPKDYRKVSSKEFQDILRQERIKE